MYPHAIYDRIVVNNPTLTGLSDLPATIDTLAMDATSIIQATTRPNDPAVYGGQPIGPVATQVGIGVGTFLLVVAGAFLIARGFRR